MTCCLAKYHMSRDTLLLLDVTRVAKAQVQLSQPQPERKAPHILQGPAPSYDFIAGNTAR